MALLFEKLCLLRHESAPDKVDLVTEGRREAKFGFWNVTSLLSRQSEVYDVKVARIKKLLAKGPVLLVETKIQEESGDHLHFANDLSFARVCCVSSMTFSRIISATMPRSDMSVIWPSS